MIDPWWYTAYVVTYVALCEDAPMTLDLMREYIVFAKHLNFSHAALELNLTQSTLSKHIAALEKELGFPVVTRGRELQFTAQGKAFLESAQKVVHLYDAELASLRESFASSKGPVRLYEGMSRWTEFLIRSVIFQSRLLRCEQANRLLEAWKRVGWILVAASIFQSALI